MPKGRCGGRCENDVCSVLSLASSVYFGWLVSLNRFPIYMSSVSRFIRATPIWSAELADEMNVWLSFHARVELPAHKGGVLHLSAAQAYRVWVNGSVIGRGPARTAHGHARVDEWSVTGEGAGPIELVIEVMDDGVSTFCSTNEPAFVCAELTVDGDAVAWTASRGGGFTAERREERAQQVERYSYQRAFVEGYQLGVDGLTWRKPGYQPAKPLRMSRVKHRRRWLERTVALPDLSVLKARPQAVRGKASFSARLAKRAPKWKQIHQVPEVLKGFAIDQVAWPLFETLAGARFTATDKVRLRKSETAKLKAREWLRVDFAANHTGFPALQAAAITKTRLLLVFDEILVDEQVKFNRADCVNAIWIELEAGASIDFEAFEPYTFRYLQVMVWSGQAEVSDIRLRHYRNALPLREAPVGMGRTALKVRDAALLSFRQNALDVFMDCPGRERAGWLCDSFFTARAEWYLCRDNPIERAFLENYLRPTKFADLPAGMVPMCYPAEVLETQFIPNWSMFFIVELDEAVRKRRVPSEWEPLIRRRVRGLLKYFRKFENEVGLLEKLENWVFVEWSKANELVQDVNFPSNMLYAATLRSAARLLGEPTLALQAKKIEATIRKLAWQDGRFVDNAVRNQAGELVVTDHASEVCQYYAFYFGTASPRRHEALWRRLVRADYGSLYPANAFIGKIMRLELLIRQGELTAARRELLRSYLPMAKSTGTLWEHLNEAASCNHGFTAYIAVLIDQLEKEKKKL